LVVSPNRTAALRAAGATPTICFLGLVLMIALRFRHHALKILAGITVVSVILGIVAYALFIA